MNTETLIKSITGKLPQVPLIVDQVGEAIDLAREYLSEEKFESALRVASVVCGFAAEVSQPQYFKFNLVICALLKDITTEEGDVTTLGEFKNFETLSNIVAENLRELKVTKEEALKGTYRGITLKTARLIQSDQELFLIELASMTEELELISKKKFVTDKELETILGYEYVNSNIRLSNFTFKNSVQKYYNKFLVTVEKIVF